MQVSVLKLSEELHVNPSKSAGIENLAGKYLKEGTPALALPITDLCNLSILLSSFPDDCKIAKMKPLYKKEAKTKPKKLRLMDLFNSLLSKVIEKAIHNQTQDMILHTQI